MDQGASGIKFVSESFHRTFKLSQFRHQRFLTAQTGGLESIVLKMTTLGKCGALLVPVL